MKRNLSPLACHLARTIFARERQANGLKFLFIHLRRRLIPLHFWILPVHVSKFIEHPTGSDLLYRSLTIIPRNVNNKERLQSYENAPATRIEFLSFWIGKTHPRIIFDSLAGRA